MYSPLVPDHLQEITRRSESSTSEEAKPFRMDLGLQIFPGCWRRPFVGGRVGLSQQNCEPWQCDVAVLIALDVSQRLYLPGPLSWGKGQRWIAALAWASGVFPKLTRRSWELKVRRQSPPLIGDGSENN